MQQYNTDFVKFYPRISVRTLCAAKFNHFRKDKKMKGTKVLAILFLGLLCKLLLVSTAAGERPSIAGLQAADLQVSRFVCRDRQYIWR
jgi:hypothetical protein